MSPSTIVTIACWTSLLGAASACRSRANHDEGTDPPVSQTTVVKDDAAEVLAAGSPCDVTSRAAPAGAAIPALRLLAAWLGGAELPGDPSLPRPAVDDALRARGARLFAAHCTACHGDKGDGFGPDTSQLTDAPADFTTGVYELRSTPSQSLPTDEDLFRTISRGIHGTAMIPWVILPEPDRWALVAHLKTLAVDFSEDEAPPSEEIPEPPPATPVLVAQGRVLFESKGCASCHGAAGKGDGAAAAVLRDKAGRPVLPRDLTGAFYHRGSELADIYQTLRTGLDGTPMASFEKLLSLDDTWALAAYVNSLAPRHVPGPGGLECLATPVPPDPEELAGVRIVMHGLRAAK